MIALHKEQNGRARSFSSRASSRRKGSKNQWTKAAGAGLAQGSPQPVEWTNQHYPVRTGLTVGRTCLYWLPAISISRIRLDWSREKGKRTSRSRREGYEGSYERIHLRGREVTCTFPFYFLVRRDTSLMRIESTRSSFLTRHDYTPRSPENMSKACLFSGSVSRVPHEIFDIV